MMMTMMSWKLWSSTINKSNKQRFKNKNIDINLR